MEIQQIFRLLALMSNIPVTIFIDRQETFHIPELPYLPKLSSQELPALLKQTGEDIHAACVFTAELLCYGLIQVAEQPGSYAVFGPVSAIACSNRRAQNILRRYSLPTSEAGLLLNYFKEVPVCTLLRFSDFLLLADYTINRETLEIAQLLPEDYLPEDELLSGPAAISPVVNTPHDAREYERQMYALLRYGRYKEMVAFLQNNTFTGNQGSLADDLLRHQKNMVISSATLASRAALDGGLDYDTAMTIADGYIQKVELATDRSTLLVLHKNMLKTYTRLVADKRANQSESAFVNRVADVIERHMNEPINVQFIAEELGLNRCYLSSQFKKEAGINLNEFINRVKIDEAACLLVTTGRSVASVASHLAFCSPSHFQTIFKKVTGMNPSEYREGLHKEK